MSRPATAPVERSSDAGEDQVARHNRRRAAAVALLVGLLPGVMAALVVLLVGLPVAAAAALVVVTAVISWWTWRTAPGRVLHAVGARPTDEGEYPRLHNLVDGLCASMGLPRPAIFVVDDAVPNAMAVGRDPAAACLVVTSAVEESLSLVEVEGVLAHELVHVKRHDIVLAGVAVVALAPWSVLAGVERATEQVRSIVGPGREFSADQRAASVVRYPPGIGSALQAMVTRPGAPEGPWPPGNSRTAALTRWLWIDPVVGRATEGSTDGNLDDTRVRAEALSLY